MSNLKITGEIRKIDPVQHVSDKFKKQVFVVEVDGTYPKPVQFTVTQNRTEQLNGLKIGDSVEVYFNLEGREYNGKYYNDIVAWKIGKIGGNTGTPIQDAVRESKKMPQNNNFDDDLPF